MRHFVNYRTIVDDVVHEDEQDNVGFMDHEDFEAFNESFDPEEEDDDFKYFFYHIIALINLI